ncbi:MAG: glycoside hydrolase family 9 protein [Bacteroidota bacterium]|nr:glycoside hydrolase family 9 protein [Bacteroidota bacterium]
MKKFIPVSLTLIILYTGSPETKSQRISRDLNVDLLINQVGYVPHAGKRVLTKGIRTSAFDIIDLESHRVVYSGNLKPCPGDFGEWSAGDFSSLTRDGHYYIKCDTLRSYPFEISSIAYRKPMEKIVGYFSLQRCGSSTTGYLSPCHVDDGIRMDNGKHQDVTGGWHDASDLRKWVGATIYGMIGLSKTYELLDEIDPARIKILDELLWGNQYFLKMQEPDGYIMSYVGGDVKKHSDSNRWTDNIVGPDGGELAFIKPTAGKSMADMLLFGSNDDRVIRTDPLDLVGQYNFISAEAIMARIAQTGNPDYSVRCLQAAIKCFDWCAKTAGDENAAIIGASMQAGNELYKTTRKDTYFDFAAGQAAKLRKLQVSSHDNNILNGFFYTSQSGKEPFKDIWQGCLGFITASDMIATNPSHRDAAVWKQIVSDYSQQYLKLMAGKNSFGIVPYGLFEGKDPGGNRKTGEYWYRYFMQPELSWWVGINSNLASAGVGLMKASKALNDPELMILAQRQLDWIIGVNPFNSSTIETVGYNNPVHFPGSTFIPQTPVLPGAVLNGLGGDANDQPVIGNGNWQISEYWTPMVAFTLWLLTEITAAE